MKETGTGMGLPIVQLLLALYGGTIEIDSTPGKGSSFRFTLPEFTREAGVALDQVDDLIVRRAASQSIDRVFLPRGRAHGGVERLSDIPGDPGIPHQRRVKFGCPGHESGQSLLSAQAGGSVGHQPPPGLRSVGDPEFKRRLRRRMPDAIRIIDQQIINKITLLALGGTHLIAILNAQGDLVVGRVLNKEGVLLPIISKGKWGQLPIVKEVLERGIPQAATEVIPVEYLSQVGLDRQAFVPLIETPLAAPQPFDPREGTAGWL